MRVLSFPGTLHVFTFFAVVTKADFIDLPKFGEPITNVTVPVGREAIMGCIVEDLGAYKVAWLRVDTQTILTIANHVITKNHRIGVTHRDRKIWFLHIKEVKESDRGWYMCQINTDPMKSQVGYIEIVVPPDILDYPTSTDMVAREGSNVTMRCAAKGTPDPRIIWKREGGEAIPMGQGQEVASVDGSDFNISRVSRLHMGAYLCIAYNGVPPSVSKRITLIVHFPPMIWIQNQLVGAFEGQEVTLECHSEAYPKSVNYWTRDKGNIIAQGIKPHDFQKPSDLDLFDTVTIKYNDWAGAICGPNLLLYLKADPSKSSKPCSNRYEPQLVDDSYKVHMKLVIKSVSLSDFGTYKCISKNSLGHADGSIKLYQVTKEISHRKRNKEYKESRHSDLSSNEAEESTGSSTSSFRLFRSIPLSVLLTTTVLVCLLPVYLPT